MPKWQTGNLKQFKTVIFKRTFTNAIAKKSSTTCKGDWGLKNHHQWTKKTSAGNNVFEIIQRR